MLFRSVVGENRRKGIAGTEKADRLHAELKADVTQETKSSFERIIEAEKPQKEVKRYAFDVRA